MFNVLLIQEVLYGKRSSFVFQANLKTVLNPKFIHWDSIFYKLLIVFFV